LRLGIRIAPLDDGRRLVTRRQFVRGLGWGDRRATGLGRIFMRAISLDEALTMIQGCFAAAKERKLRPLTAVVLDAGGRLKAALKQDGSAMLRFEVAYGKAYAALAMGRPSRLVLQKQREKPIFMENLLELADGPMFLEAGGQLVRDGGGEVIGAIGVTGDAGEMDDVCAVAGIHVAGYRTCSDFNDPETIRAINVKEAVFDPPNR
jgi:uncharacterized protein GlcG (DUF336 family)